MAIRNNHRRGDYLAVDDNSGFVVYASQLRADEYGFLSVDPDKYNMQKQVRAFGDPYPVPFVRPDAVFTPENFPLVFVGNTNVPVNRYSAGWQALSQSVASAPEPPGDILDQSISYSLVVY